MTTEEKIAAIEASGLMVAFDECHKLYLLEGAANINEASQMDYSIYPASEIRSLINRSCGLVMVHAWHLGEHPWDIPQFEMPESWYGDGDTGGVDV